MTNITVMKPKLQEGKNAFIKMAVDLSNLCCMT